MLKNYRLRCCCEKITGVDTHILKIMSTSAYQILRVMRVISKSQTFESGKSYKFTQTTF